MPFSSDTTSSLNSSSVEETFESAQNFIDQHRRFSRTVKIRARRNLGSGIKISACKPISVNIPNPIPYTEMASTSGRAKKITKGKQTTNPATKKPVNRTPRIGQMVSEVHPEDFSILREVFGWLKSYEFIIPGLSDRVHRPPDGYFAIYLHHIDFGFSCPLPAGISSVLRHTHLCPAQIHPNSWLDLFLIYYLCCNLGIQFDAAFFSKLGTFTLRPEEDHYYLSKKAAWYHFGGKSTSLKGFKPYYLFLKTKEDDEFPTRWGLLDKVNTKIKIDRSERNRVNRDLDLLGRIPPGHWSAKEALSISLLNLPLIKRDCSSGSYIYCHYTDAELRQRGILVSDLTYFQLCFLQCQLILMIA